MRRLLLGLTAACLISFVALQAAHAHGAESRASRDCRVCVLGAQAVGEAPAAAPAVLWRGFWTPVEPARAAKPSARAPLASRARAPPAA